MYIYIYIIYIYIYNFFFEVFVEMNIYDLIRPCTYAFFLFRMKYKAIETNVIYH